MKHILALMATGLLLPWHAIHAAGADKPKVNILHIHADDHRAAALRLWT